ncbi:hypothetical protein [Streptomyces prunicolor]|uniref:hypothetical protein n=1 Tax=Streptomyces prunicolor TaxID=67348 RepID=UPI001319E0FF|nr:hypothetical protein [Streptomyces prunicolor]
MEQPHNATPEPFEAPEALLITGDALRDMTPDRLETISQMLGGLGLRMTAIADLESLSTPEEEPEPVPVSKADFLRFAEETGRTPRLATMAWVMVDATERLGNEWARRLTDRGPETLPALSFSYDEQGARQVDLRTVSERIKASARSGGAWTSPGDAKISFLGAICGAKIALSSDKLEEK